MLLENGRIVAHIYRCVCVWNHSIPKQRIAALIAILYNASTAVTKAYRATRNERTKKNTIWAKKKNFHKSAPCTENDHLCNSNTNIVAICSFRVFSSLVLLLCFAWFEISYGVIKITAKLILDVEIFGSTGSIMRTYFPMMLAQMKPVDNLLMHNFTWQIHRVIS